MLYVQEGVSEHCATTVGDTIVFTGGRCDQDRRNFVMTYNPTTNIWHEFYQHQPYALNIARSGHVLDSLGNGTMFCMGGNRQLEDDIVLIQTPFKCYADLLLDCPTLYDQFYAMCKQAHFADVQILCVDQ